MGSRSGQDLDISRRPVHADPLAVADQPGGVHHPHHGREDGLAWHVDTEFRHRSVTRLWRWGVSRRPLAGCLLLITPKSLMKKFKDRAFAAGVDREEVEHSVAAFGVDLKEHIQFVIEAMRGIAGELGMEAAEDRSGGGYSRSAG